VGQDLQNARDVTDPKESYARRTSSASGCVIMVPFTVLPSFSGHSQHPPGELLLTGGAKDEV
jgi:hypothetical protein